MKMKSSKILAQAAVASAVAGLLGAGSLSVFSSVALADDGHCMKDGANACKGTSACKTASNACAGQNGCKGQGMKDLKKTAASCTAMSKKDKKVHWMDMSAPAKTDSKT